MESSSQNGRSYWSVSMGWKVVLLQRTMEDASTQPWAECWDLTNVRKSSLSCEEHNGGACPSVRWKERLGELVGLVAFMLAWYFIQACQCISSNYVGGGEMEGNWRSKAVTLGQVWWTSTCEFIWVWTGPHRWAEWIQAASFAPVCDELGRAIDCLIHVT